MSRGHSDHNGGVAGRAAAGGPLDASRPDYSDISDEEAALWWASLPEFIKTDVGDLPAGCLVFAQSIFTLCGAPGRCPQQACRRTMRCQGGDGPPCFRADRRPLDQMLFLSWMAIKGPATNEEAHEALALAQNPYRWIFDDPPKRAEGKSGRRRRR
jgi:hypothetical protein